MQRASMLRLFVGGAFLGLGFLTKMWLIVPYLFAVSGFILVRAFVDTRQQPHPQRGQQIAICVIGFVAVSLTHLAFVAWTSERDLAAWVHHVYLGIFSGRGVTGEKLSGLGQYLHAPRWFLYYPLILYRDHCFLLPIICFGLPALTRRPTVKKRALVAIVFGALLALVVLSVPAVKERLYVLAAVPFLYVLAGLCLAALIEAPERYRAINRTAVRAGIVVAGLSIVLFGIFLLAGTAPTVLTPGYYAAHSAAMLAAAFLGWLWLKRRALTPFLLIFSLTALSAYVVVETWLGQKPIHPTLAKLIAPHLKNKKSAYPSYVSVDCRIMQGYLMRNGLCWESFIASERNPGPQGANNGRYSVYILGKRELADPSLVGVLAWLEVEYREISKKLDKRLGYPSGYRVFVSRLRD
jgi:hypothetical protein